MGILRTSGKTAKPFEHGRPVAGLLTTLAISAATLWFAAPGASAASAAQVAAGSLHTCAVTTGGGVKCWGYNGEGGLGDGTTTERHAPVDVTGLGSGVKAIVAGNGDTCALTTGGGVKCWGNNQFGQIGDGTTTERHVPVDVTGLGSGVKAIAAGNGHACALTTGGGVKCWGFNGNGQLGDGTTTGRHAPVDVTGLGSGVKAIATGNGHTCALTTGGGVQCWGGNDYGQLGDGTTTGRHAPVDVTGLGSGVKAIAGGFLHSCALTVEGAVKCWGWNGSGQLGNGTTTERHVPVNVKRLGSGVKAIATSGYHTCARTAGGGMKCWGYNSNGQVGDGTTTNQYTAVDVIGLGSGVEAIAAGYSHTCALTTGGGLQCWGWNEYGQIGNGATTDKHKPVSVTGFEGKAPTSLSITVPAKKPKGTKVTVTGKLSSPVKACTKGQTVTLKRDGKASGTAKTKASGAYAFSFKLTKKTTVQVTFAKTAECKASTSAKKTIKLA